jgi:CMP-N-acetylneuraminic acid synthetase
MDRRDSKSLAVGRPPVLSTDDDEIAQVGASLGLDVPFRRPARDASDDAAAADVGAMRSGR